MNQIKPAASLRPGERLMAIPPDRRRTFLAGQASLGIRRARWRAQFRATERGLASRLQCVSAVELLRTRLPI